MSTWAKIKKEASRAGKKVVREVENAAKDTAHFVEGGTKGFKKGHAERRGEDHSDNKSEPIKESETIVGEDMNPADGIPDSVKGGEKLFVPTLPVSALHPSVVGVNASDNGKKSLLDPNIEAEGDGSEIKADKFAADLIRLLESIKENAPDFLEIYGDVLSTVLKELHTDIADWMLNNVIIQDIASSIVVDALSNYIQGDHSDITISNEAVKNFAESVLSDLKESVSPEEFVATVWGDDTLNKIVEEFVGEPKVDEQQNSIDETQASLSKSEEVVENIKIGAIENGSVDSPVIDLDDTDSKSFDNLSDDCVYDGAIIGNNVGPFSPETVVYRSDNQIESTVTAQNITYARDVDTLGTEYSNTEGSLAKHLDNSELSQPESPQDQNPDFTVE